MAQNIIAGPGMGLPLPANIYPASLLNGAPNPESGYEISLAAGQTFIIPAGDWIVGVGKYSVVQYLDPVIAAWRMFSSARVPYIRIRSDGFNFRVANLTGCPVAAVVTNGGSNYVQATTSVSVNTGNSTWQPIVGGSLASISVTAPGAGYGIAPFVFIPAPPAPGVQATAVATISSGTVSSITLTNVGAGYPTVPSITILPSPFDPNLNTITQATGLSSLTNSGKVVAVVNTNPGVSLSAQPTLTISGAGSSAAATAVWMNTITGISITAAGSGYAATTELTTLGGVTAATPAFTNPNAELTAYTPRQAQIGLTVAGATISTIGTIYDGGLFTGAPSALVLTNGIIVTVATITLTTGGANDFIVLQQC